MRNRTISKDQLIQQLLTLGVQPGGVLVVHTSFSKVQPVENGPMGLIAALQTALGPEGTLVMPSMTSDDDHLFDPKTTPSAGMGIVADTFWRLMGVLRSDNPAAFAALGPQGGRITTFHPVDPPHGLDSPVGRVYELDGQVLLLGVGHDSNTTIHLAESLPVFGTGAKSMSPSSRRESCPVLTTRRSTTVVRTSICLIGGLIRETYSARGR